MYGSFGQSQPCLLGRPPIQPGGGRACGSCKSAPLVKSTMLNQEVNAANKLDNSQAEKESMTLRVTDQIPCSVLAQAFLSRGKFGDDMSLNRVDKFEWSSFLYFSQKQVWRVENQAFFNRL
jgi:hypothetical protein